MQNKELRKKQERQKQLEEERRNLSILQNNFPFTENGGYKGRAQEREPSINNLNNLENSSYSQPKRVTPGSIIEKNLFQQPVPLPNQNYRPYNNPVRAYNIPNTQNQDMYQNNQYSNNNFSPQPEFFNQNYPPYQHPHFHPQHPSHSYDRYNDQTSSRSFVEQNYKQMSNGFSQGPKLVTPYQPNPNRQSARQNNQRGYNLPNEQPDYNMPNYLEMQQVQPTKKSDDITYNFKRHGNIPQDTDDAAKSKKQVYNNELLKQIEEQRLKKEEQKRIEREEALREEAELKRMAEEEARLKKIEERPRQSAFLTRNPN